MNGFGLLLARNIEIDELASSSQRLAPFEDGEQADGEEGAEDPDDADRDPAGKEWLAKNICRPVHGHGPEDQE